MALLARGKSSRTINHPVIKPVASLIILLDCKRFKVDRTTSTPIRRKTPTDTSTILSEGNSPFIFLSRRTSVKSDKKMPKYMPVHLEHTGIFRLFMVNDLSILWWHKPPPKKESISSNIFKLSGS